MDQAKAPPTNAGSSGPASATARGRRALVGARIVRSSSALGVLLVAALLAEAALRAVREDRFFPYHRNSVRVFYPSEEITPGVRGVSHFSTNSLGTRGPELGSQRIRILTVGGSTTACTVLDDSETWPQLLMERLNADAGDPDFAWVTNSGVDGHNSEHHLMHVKYLLPRLPRIDYVIVYAGLNDVGMWLYVEDFDPHALENEEHWNDRVAEAFRLSNYTPEEWPWYKHLELYKRASVVKDRVLSSRARAAPLQGAYVEDAELRWMQEAQRDREQRSKEFVHRAKMDTLPAALAGYDEALTRIAKLIREAGAKPIFVPQAIQHLFLDDAERKRLWMGAMDGGERYVHEAQMLELLLEYNARMREVAERENVAFIDLPELLHGETQLFYDGVHFNEKGARVTAERLAEQLEPLLRE